MPTLLGKKYDIWHRGYFPQMLNEDYPIWERYLGEHCREFLWFYYNVHVGGFLNSAPEIPESIQKAWWKSTAKRIDAIGEKEKEIWIIEVSARPGFRAVGQVMTYQYLWRRDPKIDKPCKTMLVGRMLDDDLEAVMMEMGIAYIEI